MQYIYLFHLIIWMNQKYYLSLQQKITMTEKDKYYKDIAKAVKFFWNTKKTQLKASSDYCSRKRQEINDTCQE